MSADKPRKPVARWRKQPSESGLRSIGQPPRGYELRINGETIIHVASAGGGALNGPCRGWYWYGMNQNTCRTLFATKEEARANASAYYAAHKDELT